MNPEKFIQKHPSLRFYTAKTHLAFNNISMKCLQLLLYFCIWNPFGTLSISVITRAGIYSEREMCLPAQNCKTVPQILNSQIISNYLHLFLHNYFNVTNVLKEIHTGGKSRNVI